MPRIIVRKGYRCLPGKRREVLAALQRVDEAAAGAGWPRGRYLFVETRAPGEPDLEVEFAFESYAEMERLERRLREHLARAAREVALAGQEHLLEPSATRHLLLLDEPGARSAPVSPPAAVASRPPPRPQPSRRHPRPRSSAARPARLPRLPRLRLEPALDSRPATGQAAGGRPLGDGVGREHGRRAPGEAVESAPAGPPASRSRRAG